MSLFNHMSAKEGTNLNDFSGALPITVVDIGNSILQSNNVYDRNSSSKCTPLLYGARVNSTRTITSTKLHVGIVADCPRQSNKTRAISRFRGDQCV